MTRAMLLGELLPELEGLSAELAITGLVQDSRELKAGDAFVAIGGFGTHGLAYADQVREAGYAAEIFPAMEGEKRVYTVRIRNLPLKIEADSLANQLRGKSGVADPKVST